MFYFERGDIPWSSNGVSWKCKTKEKKKEVCFFFSATFISELCSVVIFQSDLDAYMQAMPQAILQEPVDMSVFLSECHNNFITSVIFWHFCLHSHFHYIWLTIQFQIYKINYDFSNHFWLKSFSTFSTFWMEEQIDDFTEEFNVTLANTAMTWRACMLQELPNISPNLSWDQSWYF